jgi:hypothetical protein
VILRCINYLLPELAPLLLEPLVLLPLRVLLRLALPPPH